jgi:hypothetical protein
VNYIDESGGVTQTALGELDVLLDTGTTAATRTRRPTWACVQLVGEEDGSTRTV